MGPKRENVTRLALLFAWCLLLPVGAASAQTVVRSFDGDKGLPLDACKANDSWCGRQPELNVAANGKQVVQVTRQNVRTYDYTGKLLQSTPLAILIRNAGLNPMTNGGKGPFEPHVVFDEFIGRWLISASCANDCLLVSASADSLGKWGGIYPSCLEGGPCLPNNPSIKLGYDKNGVYYCDGHPGDTNPLTGGGVAWDCFALPSEEVKTIADGQAPAHLNRGHNMPLDVVPAIDQNPDKAPNAPAFFMNKSCKGASCQRVGNDAFTWVVNTFTWNGRTGTYNAIGPQQSVKTDVGSTANTWLYNTPCCGTDMSIAQAGSPVTLRAAGSHRVMNVLQAGSHLHGVLGSGPCTKDCGPQGTDTNNLMFYVDLDCSKPTACVVAQTAKISGADFNAEFGTVGVDAAGNVGIVASSSTATTNLGVFLWSRKKTDPPNTFSGPMTIVAGTKPYACIGDKNLEPMGNTVGILTTRDPLDATKLWTTAQWQGDATPCGFNTRILQYQIAPAPAKPAASSKGIK
ncbi:MAG TPA: hypothetical protein VGK32_12925 [Vicinamibacterales bacterium]|jgi:hypothetical protein